MMARADDLFSNARMRLVSAALIVSMLLMAAGEGWPQVPTKPGSPDTAEQPNPQQDAPARPTAAGEREEKTGLFNELGKMFDKLPALKTPQQAIDDFNASARESAQQASDSLTRLAKPSSMVSGRVACPMSANGAPDCKLGADRLCQAKGFKEGKSLNTDSAETCSAKVLIPGRARKPDDCRTDNYVTRALCQ
jgi:hypothetical protein